MHAGVAELADALDLGSSGAIREGSSPFARTTDRSASAHSKGAMMARNFGGTLEVTTSTREDGKTQVTVHMTADEVKKHIDKAFKDLSKTRIPGFRAGKAPRKVIEQNFGGHNAVYAQITSDMINDVAPRAIDEQDIIFIGDPEFDENDLAADGEDYEFTMFGDIKPSVELDSYDPVEIKMPSEEATQEDVDIQLHALQDYYNNFETVERAAKDGDFVMIKLASTAGGASVDALTNESRLVEIGGPMMPQELTEQLVGMKAGDEKEFDFTTEFDPSLAGKNIHTTVTVKEVREKETPELDDEFAKKVGFDTFDELVEQLKSEITSTKAEQLPRLKESRCVTELSRRIKGDIPDAYLDYTRENILRDFFNSLQEQGTTFDQFLSSRGITGEQFREDLEAQSREEAEECLALDALFTHLDMSIGEEDIEKEFSVANNPEATRKAWEDAGRMSIIREAIRRQRATKWLVDNAVVTIDNGTDDEA